jgi:hypothetical protein
MREHAHAVAGDHEQQQGRRPILNLVTNIAFSTPSMRMRTLGEATPTVAARPVAKKLAALAVPPTNESGTLADAAP